MKPHDQRIRFSLKTKNPVRARTLFEQELKAQWDRYFGIHTGPAGGAPPIRFIDLIDEYIAYVRNAKKAKSWPMLKQRLRIIPEIWPEITIGKIGPRDIAALDQKLAAMGRSEYTRNHYMGLLKAFFNWAKRAKHFNGENPIKEFKPYIVNSKRREFTPAEMARIFNAADKLEQEAQRGLPKYAARLIRLLSFTGMLLGEAINRKWAYVGPAEIRIPRTETKQKKEKAIPIMPEVAADLDSLRALDPVFVFPLDQTAKPVGPKWTIAKIRGFSGIKDFIFHGLRHTAASIMVSDALGHGVGLADIMEILGHSKVETTMRYLHANEGRKRTALGTVADRLPGGKKAPGARNKGKIEE